MDRSRVTPTLFLFVFTSMVMFIIECSIFTVTSWILRVLAIKRSRVIGTVIGLVSVLACLLFTNLSWWSEICQGELC